MFVFFQILNSFLLIAYIFQAVCKYRKYKAAYIYSPLCWFMLFYCAYFMIPVLLLRTVAENPDLFGYFVFPEEILVISQFLVAFESGVLLIFNAHYTPPVFSGGFSILARNKIIYALCYFISLIFVLSSCIALLGIIQAIRANGYIKAFFLLDEIGDKYRKMFKFQTLRYIVVVCVFYLFLKSKKFSVFLAFLPNLIFEVLAGKRTTAFLYIIFIYIIYIKMYRKTRIAVIGSVFIVLLVSVLFSRMGTLTNGNLSFDVLIASMLGEFVNTFLTIPFVLKENLLACLSLPHILYDFFCPTLPGFVKTYIMQDPNYFEIGAFLAERIGKGFGLGSNCISYDLCSFGLLGIFGLPLIFIFIWSFDGILSKDCNFIIRFYLMYQLRLYMRQGYESLAIVFYIAIFYNGLFYFMHRKSVYETVFVRAKNNVHKKTSFKQHLFSLGESKC